MKNILVLFIFFIISSIQTNAQDTLYMRNGENVLVKVSEVGATEVKYKKLDNLKGPIYTILTSDLLMIRYENGKRDDFSKVEKTVLKVFANPRKSNPFGVNINLGGPTYILSISGDYFINSSLNVELGTGIVGTFAGIKYHINGNKNDKFWTPYFGLYGVNIPSISIVWGSSSIRRQTLYVPFGIQFNKNKGLTFGVEIAKILGSNSNNPAWGALKFGYHF